MQTLLDDIELDMQELKCLMQAVSADANPTLRVVTKRHIQQMRVRLDALQKVLDEMPVLETVLPVAQSEPMPVEVIEEVVTIDEVAAVVSTESKHEPHPVASPILAERIKPASDLRHAISLNDSFRFAREIFAGDTSRMNEVIRQLGAESSLDKALELFSATVQYDEENETVADFMELLKKYFS